MRLFRAAVVPPKKATAALFLDCRAISLLDCGTVKVYLDDERPTPEGWVRAWWPDDVIALLQTGQVTDISLDHDLGDDTHGTGYDVIRWIEEAVAMRGFVPPNIILHSANPAGRQRMTLGIESIKRLMREREEVEGEEADRGTGVLQFLRSLSRPELSQDPNADELRNNQPMRHLNLSRGAVNGQP